MPIPEFKLEDWLPMSPEIGPPLPRLLEIYWPWYKPVGAEFRVSDLVIYPSEVRVGEPVTISCLAENIGTETGEYTVKLRGDFIAERTIVLEVGEGVTMSFEVVPTVAKAYSVSVNGLTGSFVATEAPIAQFAYVSDFVRNYLNAADFMTIEVQNISEVAGICTLNLSTKYKVWSACPSTPEWVALGSISLLVEPGQVVTFGEGREWIITFPVTGDTWQGCELRGITLRIEGDAGVYEKYYKHFA